MKKMNSKSFLTVIAVLLLSQLSFGSGRMEGLPPMCVPNALGGSSEADSQQTVEQRVQRLTQHYFVSGPQKKAVETAVANQIEAVQALEQVARGMQSQVASVPSSLRSEALMMAREAMVLWSQQPANARSLTSLQAIPTNIQAMMRGGKRSALQTLILKQKLQDYLRLVQTINAQYAARAERGLPALSAVEMVKLAMVELRMSLSQSDLQKAMVGLVPRTRLACLK